MESTILLSSIMGPVFLILGLSMLLYVKSWLQLMDKYENNHLSFMPIALFELVFGLISIHYHNVWEGGWPVLVTLIAWGLLLEGTFYMLAPGNLMKAAIRASSNKNLIVLIGLTSLFMGAFLSYQAYML